MMLVDPENPRPDDDDLPAPVPPTAPTSIDRRRRRRGPVEKNPPGCDGCLDGWIGETDDGRPIPCPTCRPSAAHRVMRRPHQEDPSMSVGAQRHARVVNELMIEQAAHRQTVKIATDALLNLAFSSHASGDDDAPDRLHQHLATSGSLNAVTTAALAGLHEVFSFGDRPAPRCPFCASYVAAAALTST